MDVHVDVRRVREDPVFQNPTRLGVLIHLASFASDGSLSFEIRPPALAERLTATRAQVEDAITSLATHGIIDLDKQASGKRGVWTVDMGPSSAILSGDWRQDTPEAAPVADMMKAWDSLYRETAGRPYLRRKGEYWRDRGDWTTLYDSLGPKLEPAMRAFFADKRYARWGWRFSVFFRAAPELVSERSESEWKIR
jgi:hypothetical protein